MHLGWGVTSACVDTKSRNVLAYLAACGQEPARRFHKVGRQQQWSSHEHASQECSQPPIRHLQVSKPFSGQLGLLHVQAPLCTLATGMMPTSLAAPSSSVIPTYHQAYTHRLVCPLPDPIKVLSPAPTVQPKGHEIMMRPGHALSCRRARDAGVGSNPNVRKAERLLGQEWGNAHGGCMLGDRSV